MKPENREKSQNAFASVRGVFKTAIRSASASEEIMRTAKFFTNLDGTMKSTHQSMEKIIAGMVQLQERNTQMLDTLHIIPQIHDGLKLEELVRLSPQ
ncbi:7777_t:CDS:2 [Paraglomus occultum]|uniref:BLOC-1-related complex subunit 7 n=1 Tax=Paraglomus occultum TaxID=144539 RepID=A0A9N9CT27_9GLOM|nr:7777_t:CDS:2 [Paraglomus occultum]